MLREGSLVPIPIMVSFEATDHRNFNIRLRILGMIRMENNSVEYSQDQEGKLKQAMIPVHIEFSLFLEDGMLGNDIDKPRSLLKVLFTSLLDVLILQIKFLPDIVKLIEHLEAGLVFIADLIALGQVFLLDLELRSES